MQMDTGYTSTFSTNAFAPSSDWLYSSTADMQAWDTPGTRFQDTAMSAGAPETQDYPSDHPISPSSNSTSSGYTSFSAESSIAGGPYLATSYIPSSSYSADTDAYCHPYLSPFEQHDAPVMRSSPELFESDMHFDLSGGPHRGGLVQEDLSFSSPATSSNGEQAAGEERPGQALAGKPNAASSRASSSANEASIVCPSCRRTFSFESSLQRHRNESCCGSGGGAKRLFYCDPSSHFGCKKGFKRRDSLKQHYRKLGRPEEWIDEKIREWYGKGMHRRRI